MDPERYAKSLAPARTPRFLSYQCERDSNSVNFGHPDIIFILSV